MKLRCLQDYCPKTGRLVDMRRCCGAHSWSEPCKHYGGKPWKEYMYATCAHPYAQSQTQNLQDRNLVALEMDKYGLLCFYDVNKSQEVTHCCKVLAGHLRAFWDDCWRIDEIEND